MRECAPTLDFLGIKYSWASNHVSLNIEPLNIPFSLLGPQTCLCSTPFNFLMQSHIVSCILLLVAFCTSICLLLITFIINIYIHIFLVLVHDGVPWFKFVVATLHQLLYSLFIHANAIWHFYMLLKISLDKLYKLYALLITFVMRKWRMLHLPNYNFMFTISLCTSKHIINFF